MVAYNSQFAERENEHGLKLHTIFNSESESVVGMYFCYIRCCRLKAVDFSYLMRATEMKDERNEEFNKNCDKDFMMRYKSRLHFDMNQPITVGSKTSTFAQNLLSLSFYFNHSCSIVEACIVKAKTWLHKVSFSFPFFRFFLSLFSRSVGFGSFHNLFFKLRLYFDDFC